MLVEKVSFVTLKSETVNHANVWWTQSGPDSANLALKGAPEFTKEQSLSRKVPDIVDSFEKMPVLNKIDKFYKLHIFKSQKLVSTFNLISLRSCSSFSMQVKSFCYQILILKLLSAKCFPQIEMKFKLELFPHRTMYVEI